MGLRHERADLHVRMECRARRWREVRGAPPDQTDRRARQLRHVRPAAHQVRAGRGPDPRAGQRAAHRADDHAPGRGEVDGAQSLRIRTRGRENRGLVTVADARREMTFLLAGVERRVLQRLAVLVPRTLRSNHLTVLGTLGAVGAGTAYALTTYDPAWLWVATLMLGVNWLGDSLDGTLARVRQTQRPKYGYYLDHIVDAFSTAVIGLGIGLSPYVDVSIALGLVVAYLALSINVYLESTVFGVFRLAYGRIGPTEVRIILVLLNTVVVVYEATSVTRSVPLSRIANWGMGVVLVGMIVVLVARFAHNVHRLAKLEPQRFRWWE